MRSFKSIIFVLLLAGTALSSPLLGGSLPLLGGGNKGGSSGGSLTDGLPILGGGSKGGSGLPVLGGGKGLSTEIDPSSSTGDVKGVQHTVKNLFDLLNNTLAQVIEFLRRLLTPEQYEIAMGIANNNSLTDAQKKDALIKFGETEGIQDVIAQILALVDRIRETLFGKLQEMGQELTGPVQDLLEEIVGIYKDDSLNRIDECYEVTELTTKVLMDKPAVLQELLRVVGAIPQCVVGNLVGQLLTGNLLGDLISDVNDIVSGLNLPILGDILGGDDGLLGGLLGGDNGLLGGLLGGNKGGLPILGSLGRK